MYRADRGKRGILNWRRMLNPVFIGVSLLIIGVVFSIFLMLRPKDPIPGAIASKVGFSLFYPSKLPDGYKINDESFEYTNNRVSYTISSETKPDILVTIQPKPTGYDLDNFNQKLPGRSELITESGTAVIGQAGKTKLSSLVSDGAWVLISTSADTPDKAFNQVTKSLSELSN